MSVEITPFTQHEPVASIITIEAAEYFSVNKTQTTSCETKIKVQNLHNCPVACQVTEACR